MPNLRQLRLKENSDEDGDTALHFAAASGKPSLIFNYLTLGYDVNAKNNMEWTPLMLASRNGHSESVKLLLEFGGDILARSRYGIYPLTLAVAGGNLETVTCLINEMKRKRVHLKELTSPVSPVIIAILLDHVEILKYLLKKGFEINTKSEIGDIPLETFRGLTNNAAIMEYLNDSLIYKENNTSTNLLVPNNSFCSNGLSPLSGTNFNNLSIANNKSRNHSNLSISGLPKTPDFSPIVSTNCCSFFLSPNLSSSVSYYSPQNSFLNKRFSLQAEKVYGKENNKRSSKIRSHSCNTQSIVNEYTNENNDLEDEVFENSPENVHSNNREFIELLRKHSLDSCIELFEKHEIDLDVFLTLSKGDLDEIGIKWDKRAHILELIYLLNK